jgi:hypothetical protein
LSSFNPSEEEYAQIGRLEDAVIAGDSEIITLLLRELEDSSDSRMAALAALLLGSSSDNGISLSLQGRLRAWTTEPSTDILVPYAILYALACSDPPRQGDSTTQKRRWYSRIYEIAYFESMVVEENNPGILQLGNPLPDYDEFGLPPGEVEIQALLDAWHRLGQHPRLGPVVRKALEKSVGSEDVCEVFLDRLQSARDESIKRSVLGVLSGASPSIDTARRVLSEILIPTNEPELIIAGLQALRQQRFDCVDTAARDLFLDSDNAKVRREALALLAARKSELARSLLPLAAADSEWNVRSQAAFAATAYEGAESWDLIQLLAHDRSVDVRRSSMLALSSASWIPTKSRLALAKGVMQSDPDAEVRRTAVEFVDSQHRN